MPFKLFAILRLPHGWFSRSLWIWIFYFTSKAVNAKSDLETLLNCSFCPLPCSHLELFHSRGFDETEKSVSSKRLEKVISYWFTKVTQVKSENLLFFMQLFRSQCTINCTHTHTRLMSAVFASLTFSLQRDTISVTMSFRINASFLFAFLNPFITAETQFGRFMFCKLLAYFHRKCGIKNTAILRNWIHV